MRTCAFDTWQCYVIWKCCTVHSCHLQCLPVYHSLTPICCALVVFVVQSDKVRGVAVMSPEVREMQQTPVNEDLCELHPLICTVQPLACRPANLLVNSPLRIC